MGRRGRHRRRGDQGPHQKAADEYAAQREVIITPEQMRSVEKNFLLQMIDLQWREHLMHLDHLRNVIGLRGYGQRDPLNEYKTEAFSLFEKLLGDLRTSTTRWLMTVEIAYAEPEIPHSSLDGLQEVHLDPLTGENAAVAGAIPDGLSPQHARGPCRSPPAGTLGTHQPKRPLPLRLGQEVQAVPRLAGVEPVGRAELDARPGRPGRAFCFPRKPKSPASPAKAGSPDSA
ncbi:hypothetical protein ACRAWD_01355 [Caulobacter segnis]